MIDGMSRRYFGVAYGVVTDNKDPEGNYRVKVKFPWIRSTDVGDDEDFLSNWARVASPMAGKGRGMVLLPEPEDEVLVAFEAGSLRYPVVIGCLWNKDDSPPWNGEAVAEADVPVPDGEGGASPAAAGVETISKDNNAQGGNNDARYIKTRHGHGLLFDDGADPKVILKTANGHTLVLDEKEKRLSLFNSNGEQFLMFEEGAKKITICSTGGHIDMMCTAGTFKVRAKDIDMEASASVKVKSGANSDYVSDADTNVTVSGTLKEEASLITMNP